MTRCIDVGDHVTGTFEGSATSEEEPAARFHSLAHLIDEPALARAYGRMRKDAAVGADGVTKKQYGQDLEKNAAIAAASRTGGSGADVVRRCVRAHGLAPNLIPDPDFIAKYRCGTTASRGGDQLHHHGAHQLATDQSSPCLPTTPPATPVHSPRRPAASPSR